MNAREVYEQSNGDVTKAYYAELIKHGPAGEIAMNLMRAHKASHRAKIYRGSSIGAAYDKKEWAIEILLRRIISHGEKFGITYGWKEDPGIIIAGRRGGWIIYIDLPTGQCSFHLRLRGAGPDYSGEWDGMPLTDIRILRYCDNLMGVEPEDLAALRKREANEPVQGPFRNDRHRRGVMAARDRRIAALGDEIRRLAGEEVRHVERQAEMVLVQAEMFA